MPTVQNIIEALRKAHREANKGQLPQNPSLTPVEIFQNHNLQELKRDVIGLLLDEISSKSNIDIRNKANDIRMRMTDKISSKSNDICMPEINVLLEILVNNSILTRSVRWNISNIKKILTATSKEDLTSVLGIILCTMKQLLIEEQCPPLVHSSLACSQWRYSQIKQTQTAKPCKRNYATLHKLPVQTIAHKLLI